MEQLDQFVKSIDHWLGVIGLAIGIFNYIKVYSVKKSMMLLNQKHLFHSRSEDYLVGLKAVLVKISDYIPVFEEKKREIRSQIKTSEQIAKNVQEKFSQNAECKKLITEAQKIEKATELTEGMIGDYYVQLRGFITHLEEIKKDNDNSLPL